MTPHNTSMRSVLFALVFLSHFSLFAQSTPVFLKPNNPAATGHFDKEYLKHRAISYDQFEWLWVRTPNGQNGWILKAAALLPLDFSRQAILPKGEPIYPRPQNFDLPQRSLNDSQIITLVERKRDWYKIIYKEDQKKYYGWVRSRHLSPYSKDAGLLFSTKETHLRQKPQSKSRILKKINPGSPIIPIRAKSDWALVSYEGVKGYIPFRNIKSRMDVAIKVRTEKGYYKPHPALFKHKIREIFANPIWVGTGNFTLDLKAKPDMSSRTLQQIAPWQKLVLQGYSIKKWGRSQVSKLGKVWWPETTVESNIEIIESLEPKLTRLKSSEIYQIEKSPVVPGLRFASATNGIFRSFDGNKWYPIKGFKFGYPIKMAGNGALFVADKISFDHGESFQHFVRWDLIFNTLPNRRNISQGPIQIMDVVPSKDDYRKVTLSLRMGNNKYVQLYTPNLGKSWRLR